MSYQKSIKCVNETIKVIVKCVQSDSWKQPYSPICSTIFIIITCTKVDSNPESKRLRLIC